MSLKTIHVHPDPVLRQKAKKVPVVDWSIKKLVDDMIETMAANSGCGLAAPQVGVSLRCIVIGMPEEEPFAIINPEIVKRVGERQVEEGCLSVPNLSAEVTRSVSVIVKGIDCKGKPIRVRGRELLGQALEHEIDHLNGMLFIDRVESPSKLHKKEQPAEVDALEVAKDSLGKGTR